MPSGDVPNNGEPNIPGEGGGNPPVPDSEVGGLPNTEPNLPNSGDNTTPPGATNQSGNVGGNGYGYGGSDSYVYRGMTENDGGTQVGDTARTLGVRPGVDIPVDADGMLHPNSGGVSVSPSPNDLPSHRRPPSFGGTGKDPVWSIDINNLGPDLKFVPDSPGHGTIQPSRSMTLEEYQKALFETFGKWVIL